MRHHGQHAEATAMDGGKLLSRSEKVRKEEEDQVQFVYVAFFLPTQPDRWVWLISDIIKALSIYHLCFWPPSIFQVVVKYHVL